MSLEAPFHYRGFQTSQMDDVATPFRKLMLTDPPAHIVEIGTGEGGSAVLLSDLVSEAGVDCVVTTIDYAPAPKLQEFIRNTGSTIRFLHRDVRWSDEAKQACGVPGKLWILCDGGDKAREVRELAHHLKPGDIIMAHDYSPTPEYFNEHVNERLWNWCEITDADVREACVVFGLYPHPLAAEFQEVVWLCLRKGRDGAAKEAA